MVTLYGIPNCDTIKKAKEWLADNAIDFNFHDFRKDGLNKAQLQHWNAQVGWEVLLNKRGTTWRGLDESTKNNIDEASAIELMLEHPAMIKRPVMITGDTIQVGFKTTDYDSIFL